MSATKSNTKFTASETLDFFHFFQHSLQFPMISFSNKNFATNFEISGLPNYL